ncbi:hypothetical protein CXB51_028574 [Gossypium anomalum]|uniref:Uncharacterized protein n=1 Tax=Gossypium anomalum TaxID=47600 RepID=A0A8J5YJJ4_9ROSI|nr:hypothetical protein CXB51_028574 [Gossypium anomalum]
MNMFLNIHIAHIAHAINLHLYKELDSNMFLVQTLYSVFAYAIGQVTLSFSHVSFVVGRSQNRCSIVSAPL